MVPSVRCSSSPHTDTVRSRCALSQCEEQGCLWLLPTTKHHWSLFYYFALCTKRNAHGCTELKLDKRLRGLSQTKISPRHRFLTSVIFYAFRCAKQEHAGASRASLCGLKVAPDSGELQRLFRRSIRGVRGNRYSMMLLLPPRKYIIR